MRTKEYTILFIEDDEVCRSLVINCYLKEKLPYNVLLAVSSEGALKILNDKKVDLILTDWQLPGMSGIDLIKQLKRNEEFRNIPIIMLTGIMTSTENLKVALEAGASDYIRKPIDEVELIARTNSAITVVEQYNTIIELQKRENAALALGIMQNKNFNDKIKSSLQNLTNKLMDDKIKNEIQRITHEIETGSKTQAWKQFETHFVNVYPTFFSNISIKHPDLTPSELKLCALLRMNLSTKEIASVLFQTTDSVRVSRTRIRNKLNLEGQEQLITYLMKF